MTGCNWSWNTASSNTGVNTALVSNTGDTGNTSIILGFVGQYLETNNSISTAIVLGLTVLGLVILLLCLGICFVVFCRKNRADEVVLVKLIIIQNICFLELSGKTVFS